MSKSALQQVSDQYEQAKRAYSSEPKDSPSLPVLTECVRVWGHALHILQSQRGNFVG